MKKPKTYKSEAFAAIHETAVGMYEAVVIDKQTMRSFDHACLTGICNSATEETFTLRIQSEENHGNRDSGRRTSE